VISQPARFSEDPDNLTAVPIFLDLYNVAQPLSLLANLDWFFGTLIGTENPQLHEVLRKYFGVSANRQRVRAALELRNVAGLLRQYLGY